MCLSDKLCVNWSDLCSFKNASVKGAFWQEVPFHCLCAKVATCNSLGLDWQVFRRAWHGSLWGSPGGGCTEPRMNLLLRVLDTPHIPPSVISCILLASKEDPGSVWWHFEQEWEEPHFFWKKVVVKWYLGIACVGVELVFAGTHQFLSVFNDTLSEAHCSFLKSCLSCGQSLTLYLFIAILFQQSLRIV